MLFLSCLFACDLDFLSGNTENTVQSSPKPQGEMKVFMLSDGTSIKGVLLGSNAEGFQVQTDSLGVITIRTSEISQIKDPSAVSPKTLSNENRLHQQEAVPSSVSSLQERLIPKKQGAAQKATNIEVGSLMPHKLQEQSISHIQEIIMQDPELMNELYKLQRDPAFLEILTDPELTRLIKKGNVEALENHPKMKKIMSNPAMQTVMEKMMGKD